MHKQVQRSTTAKQHKHNIWFSTAVLIQRTQLPQNALPRGAPMVLGHIVRMPNTVPAKAVLSTACYNDNNKKTMQTLE